MALTVAAIVTTAVILGYSTKVRRAGDGKYTLVSAKYYSGTRLAGAAELSVDVSPEGESGFLQYDTLYTSFGVLRSSSASPSKAVINLHEVSRALQQPISLCYGNYVIRGSCLKNNYAVTAKCDRRELEAADHTIQITKPHAVCAFRNCTVYVDGVASSSVEDIELQVDRVKYLLPERYIGCKQIEFGCGLTWASCDKDVQFWTGHHIVAGTFVDEATIKIDGPNKTVTMEATMSTVANLELLLFAMLTIVGVALWLKVTEPIRGAGTSASDVHRQIKFLEAVIFVDLSVSFAFTITYYVFYEKSRVVSHRHIFSEQYTLLVLTVQVCINWVVYVVVTHYMLFSLASSNNQTVPKGAIQRFVSFYQRIASVDADDLIRRDYPIVVRVLFEYQLMTGIYLHLPLAFGYLFREFVGLVFGFGVMFVLGRDFSRFKRYGRGIAIIFCLVAWNHVSLLMVSPAIAVSSAFPDDDLSTYTVCMMLGLCMFAFGSRAAPQSAAAPSSFVVKSAKSQL